MGDSLFGPTIIATIIVAVPIALLIALALLRIYRRAVIRSMQQRVAPRAAPGSIGALENTPARSDEPPPHPLEIGPHDPPGDGIRLAVKEAIWRYAAVDVCATWLAYRLLEGWSLQKGSGLRQWERRSTASSCTRLHPAT